ncbi:MAG: hypothetical protein SVR81_08475, partial [Chloroflexota bacterium]|nr:hypothetical protein [Chloroflexota bacterium]
VEEDFFYYNPGDEADHTCLFFYWCEALSTSLVSDADVFDEESEVPCCLPLADLEPEDFQIIMREALKLMRESQQA